MDSLFLREQPVVSLADPATHKTFMADVFEPRPAFAEIVRFSETWTTNAVEKIEQAMERKNCAVSWIQFVVDQDGFLVIMRFEHPIILGAAKTAARVLLRCLPDEATQVAAMKSLRPLDEVDANRIRAWQTVASLRPAGNRRTADPDEPDYKTQTVAQRAMIAESNKKSVAQLLVESSDASDSDEEEVAPPLMLTDGAEQPGYYARRNAFDPTNVWRLRAEREAAMVLAEVGERPERLFYIRCRHESRRQLLFQRKVREEYKCFNMLCVVRVAMQLAKDGSLPGPGEHGRMSEFIKRCAAALGAIDPAAETDIKKLDAEQQALIRLALGGKDAPYDGCFNGECLDQKTTWVEQGDISRCSRCKAPKAFGRNWRCLEEFLRPIRRREFAKDLKSFATYMTYEAL